MVLVHVGTYLVDVGLGPEAELPRRKRLADSRGRIAVMNEAGEGRSGSTARTWRTFQEDPQTLESISQAAEHRAHADMHVYGHWHNHMGIAGSRSHLRSMHSTPAHSMR